jgi:two-component system response regulator DegU
VRVLVVDDHAGVRESVARVLEEEPDLEVVGEAVDGSSAVRLAAELEPDVILMDVVMPGLDGIDATRQILEQRPQTQVIGLSVHTLRTYVSRMLQAGARAYVLKDGDVAELLHAVKVVREGRVYLSFGIDGFGS